MRVHPLQWAFGRAQARPGYRRTARRLGAWVRVLPAGDARDEAGARRLLGRVAGDALGGAPHSTLYVARLGPLVLGAVPLHRRPRQPGVDGFLIGYLKVRPAARGMGVGELLLAELERAARAEGATSLWGTVSERNVPMRALARKTGLEPFTSPELEGELARVLRQGGVPRLFLRKPLSPEAAEAEAAGGATRGPAG